jgi:hypothetical protein
MANRSRKQKYFYLESGDWSTVVMADDRSSALKESFRRLLEEETDKNIGQVMICFDVGEAVRDLSLEDSLKFIPTVDAAEETGNSRLAAAIKSLFNDE